MQREGFHRRGEDDKDLDGTMRGVRPGRRRILEHRPDLKDRCGSRERKPKHLRVAVLLDKVERRNRRTSKPIHRLVIPIVCELAIGLDMTSATATFRTSASSPGAPRQTKIEGVSGFSLILRSKFECSHHITTIHECTGSNQQPGNNGAVRSLSRSTRTLFGKSVKS